MSLGLQLLALEKVDLIRPTLASEVAYQFRHAMVQEAAYGSLVRADRKRLHRATAEALAALFGQSESLAPEVAALLAQHYHLAGDARAQHFATLAGHAAMARYANAEAVMLFSLALEWAERAPDVEPLAALYLARGRALELNGQFAEALENYQALGTAAEARHDQHHQLKALIQRGTLRSNVNPMFDPQEGHRLAAEALALAGARGDQAAEAQVYWNLMNLHRFEGANAAARDNGERSLALARVAGAAEQEAATLNDLIHVYGTLAAWPEHLAVAAEAAQRWRALGNLPMLADSLATVSLWAALRGDYDRALSASTEAGQIARSINNLWGQSYSLSGTGMARWHRGEYAQAVQLTRECLRLAAQAGYIAAFVLNGSQLAGMLAELGQLDAALAEAQKASDFAEAHLPTLRPMGLSSLALAQIALGQLDAAEISLRAAPLEAAHGLLWAIAQLLKAHGELALARRSPAALPLAQSRLAVVIAMRAPPLEAEARLSLAQALRQTGQTDAAGAELLMARSVAESIGLRRLLWPIMVELAQLADEGGDAAQAQALRAAAQAEVDSLAAALPDPAMRATFERWATRLIAARPQSRGLG